MIEPACLQEATTLIERVEFFFACPPDWAAPVLYALGFLFVVSIAYRVHTTGVTERQVRATVANGWALACAGGLSWIVSVGEGGEVAVLFAGVVGLAVHFATVDSVVEEVTATIQQQEALEGSR